MGVDTQDGPPRVEPESLADYIEVMSQTVFWVGISWNVVKAKWMTIREAFKEFDPVFVANLTPDELDELAKDERVIRLTILHTVGDLLSIAIERARLFEKSAELGAVEERNRLAREIHETLAQGLAGIALQLETAEAHLDANSNPEGVRRAVHRALSVARDSLEEALRVLVAEMGQGIDFEPVGGARPLPPSIEAGLFRMAQEALTNATRHSRASSVILRLVTTPQEVELSVEDNGRGFDPTASPGDRYGLVGINERATLLGGRMSLESSEGVGTRLEIRVPLPPSGPGVR